LVRLSHIVDIAASSGEEAPVLFAAHRLADRLHAHGRLPLAVPAAASGGEATAQSGSKAAREAVPETVAKAVLEVMKPLHDDNRRREAEKPRRADPIRKEFGIGIVDGIRV